MSLSPEGYVWFFTAYVRFSMAAVVVFKGRSKVSLEIHRVMDKANYMCGY